jgi:hypothetical protein
MQHYACSDIGKDCMKYHSSSKLSPKTPRRIALWISLLVLSMALLLGCSHPLSGKYTDDKEIVSIEFKSDKAYMGSMLGNASELEYQVKGKDLVLKAPQGNMVLHIEDDGSLSGFGLGTTLRKVK